MGTDGGTPDSAAVLWVLADRAVAGSESPRHSAERTLQSWGIPVRPVHPAEVAAILQSEGGRIVMVSAAGATEAPHWRELGAELVLLGSGEPAQPEHAVVTSERSLLAEVLRAQGRLVQREATRRMQERAQTAEQVARFAHSIAEQFTLPRLVKAAVSRAMELCQADGAQLLLVDREFGDLQLHTVGENGEVRSAHLASGQGIIGQVVASGLPVLASNVSLHSAFDANIDAPGQPDIGSLIAVPLQVADKVVGVLEALRVANSPPFGDVELLRLEELAPHAAIAVHNVQITAALRQAQAEVLTTNVSLEKKVEERTQQIARAKREWERTFDAIEEPMAMQSGFVIRRANIAYARRVGMPITQVPGKTCYEIFGKRTSPCPGCSLLAPAGQPPSEGEMAFGGDTIYRFSAYRTGDDPNDKAVVVHYHDVTQHRVLQERLRESERLAAVGQLASGAAHEINNPLGFLTSNLRSLRTTLDELGPSMKSLGAAIELAQAGSVEELVANLSALDKPDEYVVSDGLEMIQESLDGARRVADIVKGLRELSRLEIGRLEPCCVNDSVTRALRSEFAENEDLVVQQLEASKHAHIPPLQLDQVLSHILRNARQAVSGNQRVFVRTYQTATEVAVEIRDEGPGIPRENLRRVFEPFFTTRGIGKGIGLGLTAAYGIVQRVGGRIEVESELGKGATFTVFLPHAPARPGHQETEQRALDEMHA